MKIIQKKLIRFMLFTFLLLAGILVSNPQTAHASAGFKVHFVDVGDGDAAVLQYGEGLSAKYALIDAGPLSYTNSKGQTVDTSQVLKNYLNSLGATHLEFVLLTHPHRDHIGGMITLLQDPSFTIDVIYGNPRQLMYLYTGQPSGQQYAEDASLNEFDAADNRTFWSLMDQREEEGTGIPYKIPQAGSSVYLGEARIQFYGPLENNYVYGRTVNLDSKQLNKYSIVSRIIYGSNSFLMTGDAQSETIQKILAAGYDLKAQVLKVPHHGFNDVTDANKTGDYTSDHKLVIDQSQASISVISNGYDNNGGTPYAKVLRDLSGTNCYYTSDRGTIVVSSDGQHLTIQTQKGSGSPSRVGTWNMTANKTPLLSQMLATTNTLGTLTPTLTSAANSYKLYSNKAVTVKLSCVVQPFTTLTNIQYKFVPKGVTNTTVSYTTGDTVTVKNGQSGRIYVKYTTPLGTVEVKFPGFTVDTKAPTKTKIKSNRSGIKNLKESAKNTYTTRISGNLKLTFSADFGISKKYKIEYKIVPKGKKPKNYKWKTGNTVTYKKKNRKVRIYIRFTDKAGNVTVRKTNGFYIKK